MLSIEQISPNYAVDWNPVPLRKGYWEWEHHKTSNFGMIAGLPVAPANSITMPAIYKLPYALRNIDLSASTTKIQVVDYIVDGSSFSPSVTNVKSYCTKFTLSGQAYLSVASCTPNSKGESNIKYLEITASGVSDPYVSELYMVCNNSARPPVSQSYVSIIWGDLDDFIIEEGDNEYYIPYATADNYFEVQVPTQLSKPEYKKTEEGTERDGLFFPEKIVATKEFHFFFQATEYFLDALRFVSLADKVFIQQGIELVIEVDKIDFNVKWNKVGNIADVECTFTAATVTRKTGFYEVSEY